MKKLNFCLITVLGLFIFANLSASGSRHGHWGPRHGGGFRQRACQVLQGQQKQICLLQAQVKDLQDKIAKSATVATGTTTAATAVPAAAAPAAATTTATGTTGASTTTAVPAAAATTTTAATKTDAEKRAEFRKKWKGGHFRRFGAGGGCKGGACKRP